MRWYIGPDVWPHRVLNGKFRIEMREGYSVIKDALIGFNVLGAEWDETDPPGTKDRYEIMQTMLLAAEVRFNEMKDKYGTTI